MKTRIIDFGIYYSFIAVIAISYLLSSCAEKKAAASEMQENVSITIENNEISLDVDLRGGMYTNLVVKEKPVNPLVWKLTPEQMPENNRPFIFAGHFLCTGRWGSPSKGEMIAGVPHNGEVNTERWSVDERQEANSAMSVLMSCKAPIENLDVTRKITIPKQGHYFLVEETFKNNKPIDRLSNVVQHGTIAAPFLTENTIINTNATRGFDQRTNYKYLEDSSFLWPEGKMSNGGNIDLRTVISTDGYVTTHIFEDETGWITAHNPQQNLLLGYIWKTSEYPWLNVWHHSKEGKPFVQGLEFGTTGLGQPYKLLLENNVTFYGRNSFEMMDAGEIKEKSWICFYVLVPEEFGEARQITLDEEMITIMGSSKVEIPGNFSPLM
ncbi:MAG: hypothetical protein JXQ96_13595 [Cyclobacteriaceae bacterium]